jgi:serine/threonine protein phosphatase 1
MRLLAIGDIHGYLSKLEKLIAEVRPTTEDQVVFLGDYVDRGPDSKGVIDYLIEFAKSFPKTVFLQGNHEQMMLDFMHDVEPIPGWIPMSQRSDRYGEENRTWGGAPNLDV